MGNWNPCTAKGERCEQLIHLAIIILYLTMTLELIGKRIIYFLFPFYCQEAVVCENVLPSWYLFLEEVFVSGLETLINKERSH